MYTYLLINIFSISIPLIAGFDKRLKFYQQWKYLFPAMLLTMLLFIPWDVWFTDMGIWGFNPRYLTGVEIINLPIEEWMFFIFIPYSCLFTYEALKLLVRKDYFAPYVSLINYVLMFGLLIPGLFFIDKWYTSVTFLLTSVFIALQQFWIKGKYLGRFYFSFLFLLIPFFIVNGLLTGSFIDEQVVWYNDDENLGLRIFTIPVEDSVYALLMLIMNVTFYERLKKVY